MPHREKSKSSQQYSPPAQAGKIRIHVQAVDEYRERGEMHPVLLKHDGLAGARLYPDQEQLQKWRNNFEGLKYHDEGLDATLFGAVDDMLEFPDGSLAVIDYKSSGAKEISVYDDYKMQMDVYTYILEQLGLKTARKAYFVFYQVQYFLYIH